MIKVKKSPEKRGIQWKLQLGSLYDVSLVGGNNFIFIPQLMFCVTTLGMSFSVISHQGTPFCNQ